MQKILIEITTVDAAKPEKVAETLEQMTGRQCKVIPATEWSQKKPDSVGIWYRSNPALQKDITQQTVYEVDGVLMTHHPQNDDSRLVPITELPASFWWVKMPYPPHYKRSFHENPPAKEPLTP